MRVSASGGARPAFGGAMRQLAASRWTVWPRRRLPDPTDPGTPEPPTRSAPQVPATVPESQVRLEDSRDPHHRAIHDRATARSAVPNQAGP